MLDPRAVVIPFGVPEEGRGLGLGLAALVHSHAQFEGSMVALAQLHGRNKESGDAPALPVEAFVPPRAWQDLGGQKDSPASVALVLTGVFEPPSEGKGSLHLLAFDAKDGSTRASVEMAVDDAHAGRSLVDALTAIASKLGADIGSLRDLATLEWDALESVLRAERCALHDPKTKGPHDRFAALLHMGRAVGDAPEARWPAVRLAALALDTALSPAAGPRAADAAIRALSRALDDAPTQLDLAETLAIVCSRLGHRDEAEKQARVVVESDASRTRSWAVLSEARRAKKDHAGALAAVDQGIVAVGPNPLLVVERGIVLAERGDLDRAGALWKTVLLEHPLHPGAYANLAQLCVHKRDASEGQALVDRALDAKQAPAEVLRHAVELALALEPAGLPRASRLRALASELVLRAPHDPWAQLTLGQALAQSGDKSAALGALQTVESIAPGSQLAAEAQRGRFVIEHTQTAQEVDAVLRAAITLDESDLEAVSARARRLALAHDVWPAHFALGVAERRRGRIDSARSAFRRVLELAPGCGAARHELEQLDARAASQADAKSGKLATTFARATRWLRKR